MNPQNFRNLIWWKFCGFFILFISSCSQLLKSSSRDNSELVHHLISNASSIRITDPDPTPDTLEYYEKKFSGGERQVECKWQKKFETHYCYYYQNFLKQGQRRVFFFILKDLKQYSNITSVELCIEETSENTYYSPECPLNSSGNIKEIPNSLREIKE